MGIKEANWLLLEIVNIINIIHRYTHVYGYDILTVIFHKKIATALINLFDLLTEKYGKFNAIDETERANLFKVLEKEGSELVISLGKYSQTQGIGTWVSIQSVIFWEESSTWKLALGF